MSGLPASIDVNDIRAGLQQGEFFLEYLPTLSLQTGSCVGGEALIRWRRPAGVLAPGDFMPLVDNTLLSGPITYWVLEQVATELGAWLRANNGVHVSINVPPEILGRGGLEYVAKNVGLADVADKIVLEISERGLPDKLAVDALNVLFSHPVRIALDDVGLSDGNLVLYSRMRVNIIKLDTSFVAAMLKPDWLPQKLESIAALKRTTPHLQIVAEGVESARQADLLKAAGIDMAQGWYFSFPLSAAAFKTFHKAHR